MKLHRYHRVGQALYGLYLADPLRPHGAYDAAETIGASIAATQICMMELGERNWLVRRERSSGGDGPKSFTYLATAEGLKMMKQAILVGDCTPPGVDRRKKRRRRRVDQPVS